MAAASGNFIGGFLRPPQNQTAKTLRCAAVTPSATAPIKISPDTPDIANVSAGVRSLACPICYYPLIRKNEQTLSPLVSFLYERGWRQNFVWGGFPGPEKEFEMAKEYLKPTIGGTVIDASCGSGLFSRLFAKSGLYSLVVALDFSENMLRQCDEFIKQEDILEELQK